MSNILPNNFSPTYYSPESNYVEYNLSSINSKSSETPTPASPIEISPSNSDTDTGEKTRLALRRIKNKQNSQSLRTKKLAQLTELRVQRNDLMKELGLSEEEIKQNNVNLNNLIQKNLIAANAGGLSNDKKEARRSANRIAAHKSRARRKNEFNALEVQINEFKTQLLQNPEKRGLNKFVNDILNNLNWE